MITVDQLCKDIMANQDLPMTKRVELVREIRAKAKSDDNAKSIVKSLAGTYMGYAWSRANNANKIVGAYLGYLLSKKL
jgi:hypothetical protein